MGKKQPPPQAQQSPSPSREVSLQDFAEAVQRQLANKQQLVRCFDIGGSGVKTALLSSSSLLRLLQTPGGGLDGTEQPALGTGEEAAELDWIEDPSGLGMAPGEDGFSSWLLRALPRLQRELANSNVVFGVSTAGDVDHCTGLLHDWWSGGGHPRQWGSAAPSPYVADLMGLPRTRTFVLHDGAAHLLGCSRRALPLPSLACFAVGTGVGFGISNEEGAVLDPGSAEGERSHALNGAPLSGASYGGIWQSWSSRSGSVDEVERVKSLEFAGEERPWSTPWVSLVLGRRGAELAEASFGCPPPPDPDGVADGGLLANFDARKPAAAAFGQQWAHFLQTQFLPHFTSGGRRHKVERICFAGQVAAANWPALCEATVASDSDVLLTGQISAGGESNASASSKRGRTGTKNSKSAQRVAADVKVLPLAPHGSGLIGAGIYALAGAGGAHLGLWAK
eukprot:TRINITY_DN77357_c0_g1_i1.p1 TRINITY_DN77357_c0_g1~~TRINITY_DN77357_c0_g1_i1.p1  ORF type:complete len:451 (+),score=90.88 TRINITY_DN77357_c0_g1_i1:85-1437(+)